MDHIKNVLRRYFLGGGKVLARFRNYNIALFALAFSSMALALALVFFNIVEQVSADFVRRHAVSSANAFSVHVGSQVTLVSRAANSRSVINWLSDENNDEKKLLAYEKLLEIIAELYSDNLYISFGKSLNEYRISIDLSPDDIRPFSVLDENNPNDAWFFYCAASNKNYTLTIGIDHLLQRKRVWLNYEVVQDDVLLGIISTGLEFSHVARELFAHYDRIDMRGFIIDKNGLIHMDSSLLGDDDFLHHDFEAKIENKIADPIFLAALRAHLDGVDGYFGGKSENAVIHLSSGPYHGATIVPIRFTDWSVLILYGASSLLGISAFLPVFAVMLLLLLLFALGTSAISYRLIFSPLEQLVHSLARLRERKEENIYGVECDDEFGDLSHTIQDLFTKAHYDALTGIHNRRFMETNLKYIMDLLSRFDGVMSVLMLDVDYFKKYNDTYGHEQGDACLKLVAQALSGSIIRANDFIARYGGEEFIAVLPNTDEAGARLIAQKLLESVQALNIPHANNAAAPYVTVSIGVTTGTVTHLQDWTDYVKRADEALYMSKQNGRNRHTYLDFTNE